MKKTLCLFLSLAVLISSAFAINISAYAEENEITVFDSGDTNGIVPSYSIYKHSKSQFIIPATELTTVAGQSIISVKWYMQSHKSIRNIELYLTETESTALSSFVEVPVQDKVYDGLWAYDENEKEVSLAFPMPYKYFGANLLITVIDKTGSWSMGNSFIGENGDNSSVSAHSENISYSAADTAGGAFVNFSPKTTLVSDGEYFHIHNMKQTKKTDATCTEQGREAYYFCEGCGGYFEDVNGENEISDIAIWGVSSELGHDFGDWFISRDATCTSFGEEKRICSRDESHFETREIPKTAHKTKKIAQKEATTSAAGNSEYFECTLCHNYFSDSAAKTEIKDKASVVIPKVKVDKKLNIPAASVKATCNTKNKTLTVNWNAVKGAAGYEFEYRKAGADKWTHKTTAKNNYVIKSLAKGGMYEYRVRTYVQKGKQKYVSEWSGTGYRYIYQSNLKKVTAGRGAFTASWEKDKNATSYEIQYTTDKNFKNDIKTVSVAKSSTGKTIKSLKKGKTYYVRVRAVRKLNSKNYAGQFSAQKKVKTKK